MKSPEAAPTFDALQYALYLRRRWRFVVLASAVAGILALAVSLLLPKRYTSTATILIEPPAGSDPRTSTVISPVYLESLKTYEVFALSDTLFARALDKFKLRGSANGAPIETLKARMLKVAKPRDTKVLQISVTLESPTEAHEVVQFLAEETVKLSSSVTREAGRGVLEEAQKLADETKAKLTQAQSQWSKASNEQSVEALRSEVESMTGLLYRLRRDLAEAEASAAEQESTGKSLSAETSDAGKMKRETALREAASMGARVEMFTKRTRELERAIAAKGRQITAIATRVEQLDVERRQAQAAYDLASRRVNELRSSVGSGGEWLKIIDAGIVPEKPSEPRILLNTIIAVSVALLASLVYLSMSFSTRQ